MYFKAWLGVSIGGFYLPLFCFFVLPVVAPRPGVQRERNRELIEQGRITEKTHVWRISLLDRLNKWLEMELPEFPLEILARHHIDSLSEYLEEYVIQLYLEGQTRQTAAESLKVVVQKYGWLRSALAGPWNILKTWEVLEPSQHHKPLPKQILYAIVITALAWEWQRVGVLLVVAFFGLLRPSEAIALRRKDVSLPSDHWEKGILYIRVGAPKTRMKAARDQHVRIDEPMIADWISKMIGSMPPWSRIWHGSLAAFKSRFDLLQKEVLGSCVFVPASLRPGGATYLFRVFEENLQRLQWRGRWRSIRMLEIYVQELGAAEVWTTFSPKVRAKVSFLGCSFDRILQTIG